MPLSALVRSVAGVRMGWLLAIIGLTLLTSRFQAQVPDSGNAARSGIYRSAESFRTGLLELAIDCRTDAHRIDRHLFLARPYIDLTHEGVRTRINKRDLFGFRDCAGTIVRYVDGNEYAILSAGAILMYARSMMVPAGNREGYRIVPVRFFSRSASDSLRPLTRAALKSAFPDEHDLHEALDAAFRSDEELGAFDARHGAFRLQKLLARFVGTDRMRE